MNGAPREEERITTPLESVDDEVFFDDQMEPLPDEIEVASLADVINATGLSPDALEQYRIAQSAD